MVCYVNGVWELGFFSKFISFGALVFSGICISDNITLTNRNVSLTDDTIKKDVRFVFLTDLHGRYFPGKPGGKDFDKLLSLIRKQKPDFVLVGGDMIVSKGDIRIDNSLKFIKELASEFKVYYAMGNHENRLLWDHGKYIPMDLEDFKKKLTALNVKTLDNESELLDEYNIAIHGLSLTHKYYDKRRSEKLDVAALTRFINVKHGPYNILLAHDPEYAYAYNKLPVSLILSGHMHGGLLRLPGGYGFITPRYRLFQKGCWGVHKYKNKTHVISQGLANHTLPIRLFNPGEIVTVDIKKSN